VSSEVALGLRSRQHGCAGRRPSVRGLATLSLQLVVSAVSILGCGGESSRTVHAHAALPEAGSPATDGGEGGATTSCPTDPPAGLDPCPGGTAVAEGCTYDLACTGGDRELTYRCGEGERWRVDTECDRDLEVCGSGATQAQCLGGRWYVPTPAADRAPCPIEKPAAGSRCQFGKVWSTSCGYPCASGGWTIAMCEFGIWLFDAACADDCSSAQRELLTLVTTSRECAVDADCSWHQSSCSVYPGTNGEACPGLVPVGRIDQDKLLELDAKLTGCAEASGGAWPCATPCRDPLPTLSCKRGVCAE
jgi:hypothetical protein